MAPWPYNLKAWERLSKHKLEVSPICELCLKIDRIVPSVHVHHVKEIKDGGDIFPALDGLLAVCISCHNRIHSSSGAIKGCNEKGEPLDPAHEWYK